MGNNTAWTVALKTVFGKSHMGDKPQKIIELHPVILMESFEKEKKRGR